MSQYHYSSRALRPDGIRLLRLMPNNESPEKAEIHCKLFEYDLHDLDERTHLYEALSYTWGKEEKPFSITIDEQTLAVTENLYGALLRLRDRSLERILWVDAICINQEDFEERSHQVQLMANIFSQATRVLVWLGETVDDSDIALERIRIIAENEHTNFLNDMTIQQAVLALLKRPWFQRIWILQEVAAARNILIMCGSIMIDGYTFSLGVNRFYEACSDLESSIRPVTSLIRGAIFRPKHVKKSLGRASLNMRPLSELIDMFHTHKATEPVDKVYALLGMSSDNLENLNKAGLLPDYNIPPGKLLSNLVKFVLYEDISVDVSENSQGVAIKSKGCILGQVSSVRSDGTQRVKITSRNTAWAFNDETEWTFQPSAKHIQEQDIICLLHKTSKPMIIRLCKDHFAIVVIAATPINESKSFRQLELSKSITHFSRDFLLIWDWEKPLGEWQDQGEEYQPSMNVSSQMLEHSKAEFGNLLEKATRIWNTALVLGDLHKSKEAKERLREAINGYEIGFGKKHLYMQEGQYSLTPLSWAARNGYNDIVNFLLMKNNVNLDLMDIKYSQTPLSWAAAGGHEAVVKLLLETGKVEVDSKDNNGQTPLSRAAAGGHEAVVKLLLETGKVEVDSKDNYSWTPLSRAAAGGHEAVVKLLLETGKVEVDSKDNDGQTLLSWAAAGGHEAVFKLLLETGKVEVDSKDNYGRTPLSRAAAGGHEAVVKLLLETGKVEVDSKDNDGQTLLSWAAAGGHEAVFKLLLKTGKVKVNLKDNYGWTPLSWAAGGGHEAVVKLLLETGKVKVDSKDNDSWTPLSWAAAGGHEAVFKLLLKTGKFKVDSKDSYGQTPLSRAADGGHEAVVKLLLETGKVEVDSKDSYGLTPLSRAADGGHEAVVKLLLETGKVEVDSKDNYGLTPLSRAAVSGHEAVVKLLQLGTI